MNISFKKAKKGTFKIHRTSKDWHGSLSFRQCFGWLMVRWMPIVTSLLLCE